MTVNGYRRIKGEGRGVATPLVGKLNQKGSYFAISDRIVVKSHECSLEQAASFQKFLDD